MAGIPKSDDPLAVAKPKSVAPARLHEALEKSLQQNQNLPHLLMTAPLAINLLGQIRLLAFSDQALLIQLREPGAGFRHLRLPSAMLQIVNQSCDAFDSAEKNMSRIKTVTEAMLQDYGPVHTILRCLHDQGEAKNRLLESMTNLQTDMENCEKWAEDTETKFDALVKCADEVNSAMADATANAAQEKERIRLDTIKTEVDKEIQSNHLVALQAEKEEAQSAFDQAETQYQKNVEKGETSAMATTAAIGVGRSLKSVIGAAIGIIKETPKVATEAVRAAGLLAQFLAGHQGLAHKTAYSDPKTVPANDYNTSENRHPESLPTDPALLQDAAKQIEEQLLRLKDLLNDDFPMPVEEGESDVSACIRQLKALKEHLGKFQGIHTIDARGILEEALRVATTILKHRQTDRSRPFTKTTSERRERKWKEQVESLLERVTRLKPLATSQPDYGLGASSQVSHDRHQKLIFTRNAMKEASANLKEAAEKQRQAEAKMVEMAQTLKNFEHRQATLEDNKKTLRDAIDTMAAMQSQIRELKGFFGSLANIVSIDGKRYAEQYLRAIEAGITNRKSGGNVSRLVHSERPELGRIRETVMALQGHCSRVKHSTEMYEQISTAHIMPCLRMATSLRLSAGPAQQEEEKRQLRPGGACAGD
ncbi:hypothetical protein N658DRAFT_560555 [Parathielavia hyrcaniae]|uniref:Uncharacterized protein n=1 Tax=Parathielavia hyrcaniae TaxID=113614 RepID=A0AAN6PWG7_9PEZI|nr:hypothetical protein N658DRAFT_560555 [Parathielavia hyrcaniae]